MSGLTSTPKHDSFAYWDEGRRRRHSGLPGLMVRTRVMMTGFDGRLREERRSVEEWSRSRKTDTELQK